ncbi:unnamed protein product [Peniophora sp. CBMAI 1063]|nr:unnamed protein product [Peniophora sp. CBMAI 1063]
MPPMSFIGTVTRCGKMEKTATVTVTRPMLHKRTGKLIAKRKKFLVHDEQNKLLEDDQVVIRNCPPVSARKRFTLERVLASPAAEAAAIAAAATRGTSNSPSTVASDLSAAQARAKQAAQATEKARQALAEVQRLKAAKEAAQTEA